jgi:hypothetical protein
MRDHAVVLTVPASRCARDRSLVVKPQCVARSEVRRQTSLQLRLAALRDPKPLRV